MIKVSLPTPRPDELLMVSRLTRLHPQRRTAVPYRLHWQRWRQVACWDSPFLILSVAPACGLPQRSDGASRLPSATVLMLAIRALPEPLNPRVGARFPLF